MPVLDAKALETDPEGMELLRSVLQSSRRRKAPTLSVFQPAQPGAQLIAVDRPAKSARKPRSLLLAEAPH